MRCPPSLAARMTETVETGFDPASGAVSRAAGGGSARWCWPTAPSRPIPRISPRLWPRAAADALRPLPWTDAARQLQARVALMRGLEPAGGWPDLSDAALAADRGAGWRRTRRPVARWPSWPGSTSPRFCAASSPWELAHRLDRDCRRICAARRAGGGGLHPAGPAGLGPRAGVLRLTATPRLAGGRVELRLALLSPAGRPIAITADLAGFWRGAWAEARATCAAATRSTHWPEDPARPPAWSPILRSSRALARVRSPSTWWRRRYGRSPRDSACILAGPIHAM